MQWRDVSEAPGQSIGPLPPQKELVVVILLSIFTFGVYTLIWLFLTYRDTHRCIGKPHQANIALGLGIAAYALFLVAFALYMEAIFGVATGVLPLAAIGGVLGALWLLMLAGMAMTGIQVWMVWGAAHGAEQVLARFGRTPDIPPLVHVLVPIIFNAWIYVAIGVIQNDLNKLHAPPMA